MKHTAVVLELVIDTLLTTCTAVSSSLNFRRLLSPWKESTEFIIPSNIVHKSNKILARINLYSLQL